MRPVRNPIPASIVLFSVLGIGCASSPKALIQEGESALAQGRYDVAATAFKEAQLRPGITQLERDTAEVGEAKSFLGKGDLVGAETRLRRMSDQRSAKWYYLGDIGLARRDVAAARDGYQKALQRTHGGDTATKLARVVAGEARSFKAFSEASQILKGQRGPGDALGEAALVWRAHLAGKAASALLTRLGKVAAGLEEFPAARVLQAMLLDAAGETDKAAAAWDLSACKPAPSDAFLAYAKALRAQLAIERGDSAALSTVLEGANVETAGRVRGELARARLWRGDVLGALELWRDVAKAGGDPAAAAAAEAASLLERLGRSAEAKPYWEQAEKAVAAGVRTAVVRRALAERRTVGGDLLGACQFLEREGENDTPAARRAADLLRAGDVLNEALAAHSAGEDALRDQLARAVLLLVPLEPVALGLVGEVVDGAPDATATSRLEFERAELVRALRAGAMIEARKIVRWWRQQGVDRALPKAQLDRVRAALEDELHGGLREALRNGNKKEAQSLVGAVGFDSKSPVLAELRACSCLASLSLAEPRGLEALPQKTMVWGSVVLPSLGLRLPRVGVRRSGPGWSLAIPGGTELTYANGEELEGAFGVSLSSAIWTRLHTVTDTEAEEEAAWRERWPAWPTVEVQ